MLNGDLVSEFDEYKDLFLSELDEIVSSLNQLLLDLEKNPKDKDKLHEVMRAAHTIKGMASTMGYDQLATLTHKVEDSLLKILKDPSFDPGLIDALFEFSDKLNEFRDAIQENKPLDKIETKDLIEKITAYAEGRKPPVKEAPKTTPAGVVPPPSKKVEEKRYTSEDEIPDLKLAKKYQVIIELKPDAPLKSARALVAVKQLENYAQIISSNPSIDDIEEGKVFDKVELEIVSNEDETTLQEALSGIQDIKRVVLIPLFEELEEEEETVVETPTISFKEKRKTIKTVRVNLDLLDYVLDLLGEIVLSTSKISKELRTDFNPVINQQVANIEASVVNIQEVIMRMRMVSLTHIYDRFPRMVRDLAKQQKKKVELIIRGSHLELDRSVIDQVNQALLHLVRNAVTHGIEKPAERKRAGKKETGTIIIDTKQERGEIIISVQDDGRGIDFEKIKKKGIELGLLEKGKEYSKTELLNLIFAPNFSTASKTTEAAGRGVGLDIVKQVIEDIGGNIQVETTPGKGTTFILRVPQTVAIVNAVIIEEQGYQFALPMTNVEAFLTPQEVIVFEQGNREYISYQEQLIPLIDISKIIPKKSLYFKNTEFTPLKGRTKKQREKIILWSKGGSRVALKIRNLLGQTDIVTKSISTIGDYLPGISGATLIGEEQVVLILDPLGFVDTVAA